MATSIDGTNGLSGARPVVVSVQHSSEPSSAAKSAEAEVEAAVDSQRVSDATRKVEEMFQSVRRNLEFREEPNSGRLVISVLDAETGEIIREIPPEKMIRMAEHLEYVNGLLLGERA